jgi:hypothetical protein
MCWSISKGWSAQNGKQRKAGESYPEATASKTFMISCVVTELDKPTSDWNI